MTKYFRYHRGLLEEAMKTKVEVKNLQDVIDIINADYPEGFYQNIHIEETDGYKDKRCIPYGWGDSNYYILADFDGYKDQCIGYTNFKE